jgi:hypothetical protein
VPAGRGTAVTVDTPPNDHDGTRICAGPGFTPDICIGKKIPGHL